MRWAVIDTRPQTHIVAKKYRRDPVGEQQRGSGERCSQVHIQRWNSAVSFTGTRTVDTRSLKHTHTYTQKTACGTGFVLSDLAVILLLQDNNSQGDKCTVQAQEV